MSEQRFRDLEEALRRRGVAVSHARRAALEMEDHYRQLLADSLARGESPQDAQRGAHQALGVDHDLVHRFASRKELLSWAHRWPVGFVLSPLLCFVSLAAVEIIGLIHVARAAAAYLHHAPIPAMVAAGITSTLGVFFQWILPTAVATAFALIACRQRVAMRRSLAAISLLCVFSALLNVSCVITPKWTGVATAGLGISESHLPTCLFHAGIEAALALVLLLWMKLRSFRDRPLVA